MKSANSTTGPRRTRVDGQELGNAPFEDVRDEIVGCFTHGEPSIPSADGYPESPAYRSVFGRTKCSRVPLAPGRSAQLDIWKEMTASAPVGYFRRMRAIMFSSPKTE